MNNLTVPSGILYVNGRLSNEQAARVRDQFERAHRGIQNGWHSVVVLEEGLKFEPFPTASVVPDAICRYCTVPNLSSAAWCTQCGAPMMR